MNNWLICWLYTHIFAGEFLNGSLREVFIRRSALKGLNNIWHGRGNNISTNLIPPPVPNRIPSRSLTEANYNRLRVSQYHPNSLVLHSDADDIISLNNWRFACVSQKKRDIWMVE
jgi:hypothetical protein